MAKVTTTQFNKYTDFVSQKKQNVNELVLKFAKKLSTVKGAIFMDGKDMNTTKTLTNSGLVKGSQIYLPEIDPETRKVHKASGLANSYFGKLEDFLQTTSQSVFKDINLVFFDTMGMPEGNYSKKLYPMESLMTYLLKCQGDRVVVCLTYCLRSNGLFQGRQNMVEQIEQDYVFPCITWSQYKVKSSEYFKYHRDSPDNRKTQEMLFMAFELEKDKTIDKSNVDFVTKRIKIKGQYQTVFAGYAPDRKM
jgi:hypothetical protein